ncbi:MAG: exodeoxyribonuclease VII large subunit [Defluviitaleaceae bacterium]|nr:exodeoxyribonuclease VII large subunit [Defluviitaleaceae bacterium]
MKIYSVSQITRYIKAVLEEDVILGDICLEGELSNVKLHSSGHVYFTIKDETSAINCVMFRSQAETLNFSPSDGLKIVAWGRVSVFEKTGAYQLYVSTLKPSGLGELYLAYEQLKNRLEAKGYFDSARKRELPPYPGVVGLVTSGDGAAVADIISVLRRRNRALKIVLTPVKVQGAGAAQSVAEGIELINRHGTADVIIVGRGGGSFEDLWPFNEEAVARAVFESPIPVVSAVGHETDFTICDFVADLRAPTPSAAAELVAPDLDAILEDLQEAVSSMDEALGRHLDSLRGRLALLVDKRVLRQPMERIYNSEIYTETLLKRLDAEAARRVASLRSLLEREAALLESLSPLNTLSRGYTAARRDGAVISSAAQLAAGDEISLRFSDGEADCRVLSTKEQT